MQESGEIKGLRGATRQKRALAVHDVSCFGRCSLTVALPILSAAGIETPVIPTAVLSTHTGGFKSFTYRDLTEDIWSIVDHWVDIGLGFDAIYTGFLGSFEQMGIVSRLFDALRESAARAATNGVAGVADGAGESSAGESGVGESGTGDGALFGRPLVVCDPVMADNGKLYSIFPDTFPDGMRELCKKADIVVPNMTEAALLLRRPYREFPHDQAEVKDMLLELAALGPTKVVLTGVGYNSDSLGAASYDAESGLFGYAVERRIDPMYHGTGDVFASALTAALVHGRTLARACEVAVRFTVDAIARTKAAATDNRFGVNFEDGLSGLRALIDEQEPV